MVGHDIGRVKKKGGYYGAISTCLGDGVHQRRGGKKGEGLVVTSRGKEEEKITRKLKKEKEKRGNDRDKKMRGVTVAKTSCRFNDDGEGFLTARSWEDTVTEEDVF